MTNKHPSSNSSFFLATLILLALTSSANAGPWTHAQGKGQFITTASVYEKKRDFNSHGRSIKSDKFRKYELTPLLEYGLTNDLTIGGKVYLDHLISYSTLGKRKETGLADVEALSRYQFYKDNDHVMAFQGMVKIPGPYNKNHNPSLGAKQVDLEARILYGFNNQIGNCPWYLAFEGAYRFRFQAPADQVRLDATLGFKLTERFEVMVQSFNTISLKNHKKGAAINNPFGVDYDIYEISPSLLIRLTPAIKLQVGGGFVFAGRKVGAGKTGLLGLWVDF
jgi:protein XagA